MKRAGWRIGIHEYMSIFPKADPYFALDNLRDCQLLIVRIELHAVCT